MLKQLYNLINHGIREFYNAVLMVLDGQSNEPNIQCQAERKQNSGHLHKQ